MRTREPRHERNRKAYIGRTAKKGRHPEKEYSADRGGTERQTKEKKRKGQTGEEEKKKSIGEE
jgi:hypothetical protein